MIYCLKDFVLINQFSGSEFINYGSGSGSESSIGKSKISDPDPGKYPITYPDPTSELQIDKKDIKISKIR